MKRWKFSCIYISSLWTSERWYFLSVSNICKKILHLFCICLCSLVKRRCLRLLYYMDAQMHCRNRLDDQFTRRQDLKYNQTDCCIVHNQILSIQLWRFFNHFSLKGFVVNFSYNNLQLPTRIDDTYPSVKYVIYRRNDLRQKEAGALWQSAVNYFGNRFVCYTYRRIFVVSLLLFYFSCFNWFILNFTTKCRKTNIDPKDFFFFSIRQVIFLYFR